MDTTVFNVVHMFSEGGISAVPIVNEDGIVVNLYETVDVIVSSILTVCSSLSNEHRKANFSVARLSCGWAPTDRST